MADVAVIDYGVGNLLSVSRALEHCGARVAITSDPAEIRKAPRVVLPGVGAFADGMAALRRHGLDEVTREIAAAGTPLLGICLGMQMLLDASEEFGTTQGLAILPGRVVQVPATTSSGEPQKIPHIGWNELVRGGHRASWDGSALQDIRPGDAVYFVHSYMAMPTNESHRLADCMYGGIAISAAVQKDNVTGCQFHPEKSGAVGLRVLDRFLRS
jgi:glutamine amidotransferase